MLQIRNGKMYVSHQKRKEEEMQSFEKISKMNLADLDRPGTGNHPEEEDRSLEDDAVETGRDEADIPEDAVSADGEGTGAETVTVADVEGTAAAGTAGTKAASGEKKQMRQPEGTHYYIDAQITEKELMAFLFGHNYRQPIMLIALLIAVIWPVMVIIRNDSNMIFAIALAAIVLVVLPLSTWNRGRKAARSNPSYKQTFHYMVDEWGLHLELGDECLDLEWNKVYKCMFLKSVTAIYTGKVNAFLIPTAAMGGQKEEINAFIKEMKKK